MGKRYKLVIFDFDGTLANSFPYFLKTINVLAEQYDFPPVEPQHVDQLRGMDARQLMKTARLPAWKIPLMASTFIRLMARDIEQIHLFDGITPLLTLLGEQGVQLAIVSSNSETNIRRVLGPENAARLAYYSCGASLFGKAYKFKRVIARSGVAPEDVLCVGDELRDLEATQKAGLAFGAVAWGYTRVDVWEARPEVALYHTLDNLRRAILGLP